MELKQIQQKFLICFQMPLGGLVVIVVACCAEGHGCNPRVGSPRIFKIDFHQQKLSSLSIACDIKLEGALYSVFYAKASKILWISLIK